MNYPLLCPRCKKGYLKITYYLGDVIWECERCEARFPNENTPIIKTIESYQKYLERTAFNPSRRSDEQP